MYVLLISRINKLLKICICGYSQFINRLFTAGESLIN